MEKKFSKLLSVVLSVLMLITVIPFSASAATVVASGECGENLAWTLDDEGALTISGTGAMYDYATSVEAPWSELAGSVTSVILSDGITHIGAQSFSGINAIQEIVIPDSVMSIGRSAFFGCSSLNNISIPDTVESIGADAFDNTAHYNENSNWENHVLYVGNHLVASDSYYDYVGYDCVVRAGTKTIADSVFSTYSSLRTVTIPASVTHIGKKAFGGNPFSYITVNAENPNYSSADGILYNKDKTTLICCPSHRFDGYYSRFIIPATVTCIEDYAFYNCYYLEVIKIPDSVTSIGAYAFGACPNLADIHYTNNAEKWAQIKMGTENSDLTDSNIHFANGVQSNPSSATVIASGDLGDNLEWKLIPDGTLTITGNGEMPSVSSGRLQPWYEHVGLITKIVVDSGITEIPSYSFEYCDFAETISLPDTLKSFSINAFNDCKSLNNMLIPASVTSIFGNSSFLRCNSLSDLYYQGTEKELLAATNNNSVKNQLIDMTIHYLQYHPSTATCTQEGIQAYYQFDEPTVYGPLYDDNKQPITQLSTIPALGHDLNAVVTAPTCEDTGFTTYTCTRCSYTYTADKTAATGHKHTAVITVPTCTEQGYTTYTCKCGDSYISDYKNATGHSHRGAVTTPATHLTEGVMTYTCICGDSYTKVINKIAKHTYKAVITAPTCTEQGYTTYTCECGDSYISDYKNATGHSHSVVVTAPTCTEDGYTTYTCDCGDSYVADYTDATGHNYKSEITTPATHTTEGVMTYTCICGDSYTEAIAKLEGHTYTSKVIKEATHLEEGEAVYACECGDSYTEAITRLPGHTYDTAVTAPTCTAQGFTTYTCSCGDSYVADYVAANGHSYSSFIEKEPGCTEFGLRVYECECGDTYTGSIAPVGHVDRDGDMVCDECGETYCSHLCHKKGFMDVIWKIINFFQKLFGSNPVCECGMAHY